MFTTRSSNSSAAASLLALHVILAASFLAPVPVAGQSAEQPQARVFGEKVELVSVDVLVLDQKGNPARGLTQQDFAVKEDGVEQTVTQFEAISFEESEPSAEEQPRFVSSNVAEKVRPERAFLVIYDDVHMTELGSQLAEREFEKLVDGLSPGDVLTLVPTSGKPWWTARLPEGREDLLALARGIKGLRPEDLTAGRISDWEALQINYGRDPGVLGMVARRYYENGLIAEITPPRGEESLSQRYDVSPGLPLIRAKASQVYQDASQRAVVALDVMRRAVASLATQRGRKAVLVLSEGFFYDSTRSEMREVVKAARDANAVLYFFDARGRSGPNAPGNEAEYWHLLEERDRALTAANFARDAEGTEALALDSGGRAVKGTDELASAMQEVVRESRSYYLLGYVSSNPKRDGKFRSIKVSLARPGLVVRARKGYYAPQDSASKKPLPADALDPRVRAGIDSPFVSDTIPIRVASYVFGDGASGKATVLLSGDLDVRAVSFEARNGRQVGALETYLVVSPLAAGEGYKVEKRVDLSLPPDVHERVLKEGLPLLRDFELAPGKYQARLLVRDARGGAIGTVRHTFEVPPAEGLRISTPILSDTMAPSQGQETPVPLARRSFATGSRVVYVFDVYGAARDAEGRSQVAISYRVRRKDGFVLAEAPSRALAPGAEGWLSHRLVLSLQGAEPGEYELLLTVEDSVSGRRLERRDVFVVGPA